MNVWAEFNEKYTIDICMQMLASAEMMMMNTKDYLYSHHHHHTCFGKEDALNHFYYVLGHWNKETKKQRNKETKKETNSVKIKRLCFALA